MVLEDKMTAPVYKRWCLHHNSIRKSGYTQEEIDKFYADLRAYFDDDMHIIFEHKDGFVISGNICNSNNYSDGTRVSSMLYTKIYKVGPLTSDAGDIPGILEKFNTIDVETAFERIATLGYVAYNTKNEPIYFIKDNYDDEMRKTLGY